MTSAAAPAAAEALMGTGARPGIGSLRRHPHLIGDTEVPPGTLAGLACGRDDDVRFNMAGNPPCPPAAPEQLARDPSAAVRLRAPGNPSFPRPLRPLALLGPSCPQPGRPF